LALDQKSGDRYKAVYGTLQNSALNSKENPVQSSFNFAALAAVQGAGPLDYTDYPATHPVYKILFPGREKTRLQGIDRITDTSDLISNFSASLLEGRIAPVKRSTDVPVHIETRSWNYGDFQAILDP
jgi:hypothetical protein